MRNRIVVCALACVLALAAPAYAREVTVSVDGEDRSLAVSPVIVNDYTMVGMRELFSMLGATVWWDSASATAHATAPGMELELTIGSAEALINGKRVTLTVPAQIINDMTMVPLGVISEAFGYGVAWDGENSKVILTSPVKPEAVPPLGESLLDMDALYKSELVLEYDEAVDKAVAKNNTIKNLNDSLERLQEQRDEIWTYQLYTSIGTPSSAFITGIRAISQIDYTEQNAPLTKEMLATGAEYLMRANVSTIAQAGMDRVLLEESIGLSRFNLENNLELKLQLGLASESEVREERRALEQSVSNLAALQTSISSQKESLALMLGYKAETDLAVNYRPELTDTAIDIEKKIKDIDKDPSIVIAANAVKQAEYELDTWSRTLDRELANAPQESKLALENALLTAKRSLSDAKTAMEKALRSAHSSIKSLEEARKSLELELEKARDMYDTALVNYEAGNVTKFAVDQARVGILKAEIDLAKNLYSLDELRFAIDRPYLLTGGE